MKYRIADDAGYSICELARRIEMSHNTLWSLIHVRKVLPAPDVRKGRRMVYSPALAGKVKAEVERMRTN